MIMNVLELTSVGVGIVATVLVGVWFIVNKAFGIGRFSHRMDDVERRTANAACDFHGREIDGIKDDIKSIKEDVVVIKSLLAMKHKDAASVFSIKKSPRRLNDTGKRLLADIKGMDFLNANKDYLFSVIDSYAPKTALDVENAAHASCVACADKEVFNGFKNFIYNSPSYTIMDASGQQRQYDLAVPDVCFVLSLPLRDMYLKEHPQIEVE